MTSSVTMLSSHPSQSTRASLDLHQQTLHKPHILNFLDDLKQRMIPYYNLRAETIRLTCFILAHISDKTQSKMNKSKENH